MKKFFTFIFENIFELIILGMLIRNCYVWYFDETCSPKGYSIIISSVFFMLMGINVGARIRSSEKNLQKQIDELKESKNA